MYIVFLNGDAMGKSMQGAGGALVLGAVFKSLVERALNETSVKNLSPEVWLKNSFVELHRVFESFNGAMLITVIMGLLDEESGLLYYLNAAHPEMVLLREGRAAFIKDFTIEGEIVQKLGTTGLDKSIRISLFQLCPGDLLFLGSDGRDDIILGRDFLGNPLVNQDEDLFRQAVEEAGGDLNLIYKKIKKRGRLLDDLSLMRIAMAPSAAANTEKPSRAEGLNISFKKQMIRRSYKRKEYQEAARLGEEFLSKYPEHTSYLYLVSMAYKRISEFEKAAEFGERLLIRKPENLKNLLNLADIYLKTGNVIRAHVILKRAQDYFPGNEYVDYLKDAILGALSHMKFHLN
jgi:tetratricopeptide (TPR) repeat protein